MIIETYSKPMNRTLLKKTGTKNGYLTDVKFIKFFGYNSVNDLVTTQNDRNKIIFNLTNRLYQSQIFQIGEKIEMHIVRGVNTEGRLSGRHFLEMLQQHGITETDKVIIEKKIENDVVLEYNMSFSVDENLLVLQQYNDTNRFWLWDNYFNKDIWTDSTYFNSNIYVNGNTINKTLRFREIETVTIKMIAAKKEQLKRLYIIEELNNSNWIETKLFKNWKLLQIEKDRSILNIRNRDTIESNLSRTEVQQ